jgi:hypothetical protein
VGADPPPPPGAPPPVLTQRDSTGASPTHVSP